MVNAKKSLAAGFTLIEILIVVLIIGILTSVIALKMIEPTALETKYAAQRLITLLKVAQQQAMIQNETLALFINKNSYELKQFAPSPDTTEEWKPIENNRLLATQKLPSQMTLLATTTVTENSAIPVIIFPDGTFTPFTLQIMMPHKKMSYQLSGTQSGKLILQSVNHK